MNTTPTAASAILIHGYTPDEILSVKDVLTRPVVAMLLSLPEAEREAILKIADLSLSISGVVSSPKEVTKTASTLPLLPVTIPRNKGKETFISPYAKTLDRDLADLVLCALTSEFQNFSQITKKFQELRGTALSPYLVRHYVHYWESRGKVESKLGRNKLKGFFRLKEESPKVEVPAEVEPVPAQVASEVTVQPKPNNEAELDARVLKFMSLPRVYSVSHISEALHESFDEVKASCERIAAADLIKITSRRGMIVPTLISTRGSLLKPLRLSPKGRTFESMVKSLGVTLSGGWVLREHLALLVSQGEIQEKGGVYLIPSRLRTKTTSHTGRHYRFKPRSCVYLSSA